MPDGIFRKCFDRGKCPDFARVVNEIYQIDVPRLDGLCVENESVRCQTNSFRQMLTVYLLTGGNTLGNMAQGMPMVDIVNIRAALGTEICTGPGAAIYVARGAAQTVVSAAVALGDTLERES
jgi:hypothetical protein